MNIKRLHELLEYDKEGDYTKESLLLKKAHILTTSGEKIYHCGTHTCEDTAKSLYRLLYIFGKKDMNFSSMYKCGIVWIESDCKQYLVECYFHKYELHLAFWAKKENSVDINKDIPHHYPYKFYRWNRCNDIKGLLFFELIVLALETEWDVYGGNDFVV